ARADYFRREPRCSQSFDMPAEGGQCLTRRCDSLLPIGNQHRVAFIAHHAAIFEPGALREPRQLDRLVGCLSTASMHSGIDFDYHVSRAASPRRTRLELAHVELALDGSDQTDSRSRLEEPIDLGRPRNLICKQHRAEPRARQHLDLAQLRRRYSNRPGRELSPCDLVRLRRLEMRSEL